MQEMKASSNGPNPQPFHSKHWHYRTKWSTDCGVEVGEVRHVTDFPRLRVVVLIGIRSFSRVEAILLPSSPPLSAIHLRPVAKRRNLDGGASSDESMMMISVVTHSR